MLNVTAHRRHASQQPRGFTLLELLLALAIIVAISAVAVPNLFDALANRQLVRGADGLRVIMVQTRIDAMRSGRTQVLRAQIGGDQFQIQPLYGLNDVTEAADQLGQGTGVAMGGMATAPSQPMPTANQPAAEEPEPRDPLDARMDQNRLPDQVNFAEVRVMATARSATLQQSGAIQPGDGWSEPLLFYSDGTTSNAVLTVGREGVGRVAIKIRGLTGETVVSEVMP